MLQRGERRHPWKIVCFIWTVFVLRGAFYCVQLPMWEGFDEWAHFAYVQHLAETGSLPERAALVPADIRESLAAVPLPYSLRDWPSPHLTHDEFWILPAEQRLERQQRLRLFGTLSVTGAGTIARQYEAQQPPLYYVLMTVPYRLMARSSLPARVLAVRIAGVLIASCVIPIGYLIASRALPDSRSIALFVPLLIAALPGLFIDVCRAGNESLAIVLCSLLLLTVLRSMKQNSGLLAWTGIGATLGTALLIKAYTLAFLPLLPMLAIVQYNRRLGSVRSVFAGCAIALAVTTAIAGWWYWRTWSMTGILSGEQLDAAASQFTLGQKIAAVGRIHWGAVLDSAAFSHIWTGGWSFIVVRRWMYRVIEFVAVAAAIALALLAFRMVRRFRRKRVLGPFSAQVLLITSSYLLLVAGLAYHALVIFMTQKITTLLGWYLYAVVVAEVLLLVLGMIAINRRHVRYSMGAMVILAIALDIYTVHFVLTPYYTGLIGHRASGALEAFHFSDLENVGFGELLRRLAINESACVTPPFIAGLWAAYFVGTMSLGGLAIFLARAKLRSRRNLTTNPAAAV